MATSSLGLEKSNVRSGSFALLATVTASTKRAPAPSSGKTGVAVTNIASLKCTPLDPISAELRNRLQIKTAYELLQTFVDNGADVREGDQLVVGSKTYPIRAVADWEFLGADYRVLILEDLKL